MNYAISPIRTWDSTVALGRRRDGGVLALTAGRRSVARVSNVELPLLQRRANQPAQTRERGGDELGRSLPHESGGTRRGRRKKRDEEEAPPASHQSHLGYGLPRIASAAAAFPSEHKPPCADLPSPQAQRADRDQVFEEHASAAVASIRGLKPGNPNWVNQDSFFVLENFDARGIGLYCVLDGHGEHGHLVSGRCRDMLPQFIKTANQDMRRAFALMQSELQNGQGLDANCSGATCVLVCLQNRRLLVANCGDSRAVLCSRVNGLAHTTPLSTDHKPDCAEERRRILARGGRLGCRQVLLSEGGAAIPTGPCRVWYSYRGDSMGLAMSRSLGDLVVHNVGVSAEPELTERALEAGDEFVIVATDGVWDVVDNAQAAQLVCSLVSRGPNWSTQEAASLLTRFARNRWTKLSLSADDITAIVIKLR